ncbi:MAG: 50S ribosomal protein L16 [Candidatus Micrarchaeia archaeon]|jgi:large subunit ribosomal protein L10e
MGLRPAKTCRDVNKPSWTRHSKRRPRKSFIKAMPHNTLLHFNMGKDKEDYEVEVRLITLGAIQIRDNALESTRMTVHKYMQKAAPEDYKFRIHVFPHQVIRENKMLTGAGADRIQGGMKAPFGKPIDRAARLRKNQTIFSIKTRKKNIKHVKAAYKRAQGKLSGDYRIETIEIGG